MGGSQSGRLPGWELMAHDTTIRRAAEANLPVLHELLRALSTEIGYGSTFRADIESLRLHGFGPRPLFRALLAEQADRVLGIAIYFPEFSTQRGQPGVYLQDIYLRPDARSTGLGRRLIGAAVRDASDWGAVYLRLAAHTGNASALAFYDRLGFRHDPREHPLMVEGAALIQLEQLA
jgi:GNAT superfamily N-acetyltransferase